MPDRPQAPAEMTAAMVRFTEYFGELGPRWGLHGDTCRLHALLYLSGRPLTRPEIAKLLCLADQGAQDAIADLLQWGMAQAKDDTSWYVSGEPWDLLFAALEERQRRELEPAREMLRASIDEAGRDSETPALVRHRIRQLLELVEDLAALGTHSARFSSQTLGRMAGMGGFAARLVNRVLASSPSNRTTN